MFYVLLKPIPAYFWTLIILMEEMFKDKLLQTMSIGQVLGHHDKMARTKTRAKNFKLNSSNHNIFMKTQPHIA